VSAALAGNSPATPSSLRLGLSHELDELFLDAWRAGTPAGPSSVDDLTRELTRVLGEDRNRRPTMPGAESPSRLRAIDPQLGGLTGRNKGASALDTVDRAFDAMLAPHEEPPPLPASPPSKPPVIEFGAHDEGAAKAPAAVGAVDVTPVKPTLVGATPSNPASRPPPPEERPAVSDQPTPSVGYERLKLLASDALRDVDTAVRPTPASPSPEPQSPDATTRIGDDVLDALRKNSFASRAQPAGAKKEVPRAHGAPLRGGKPSVPPPPESATRPSASQFPPGKRRRTSKPPRDGADPQHPSDEPAGDSVDLTTIPKAPRLPGEVHALIGYTSTPPRLPPRTSVGPEVILEAPEALDEVAIVATQDILEADLPEEARRSPEPIKPSAPPTPEAAPVATSSAESTQITGTPLPPKPAHSHRPPPVREAPHERHAPPPPTKPSLRPPSDDDVITRPVGTPLRAPPPPRAEPRDTRPPGERTSVTQTLRASALPPAPQENSWAVAAKWCAVSTVVSALLVTAGFAYLRDTHRELIEELRLARGQSARVPAADAATPADAAPPVDAAAVPAAPDALAPDAPAPDATLDVAALTDAADVTEARVATTAPRPTTTPPDPTAVIPPTGEGIPDAAARARMSGAMRGAISDCVEGVEDPPFVVVSVRYDGRTGAPTRIRLHGVFQEAPMGPCIEHAVREVRAPTFSAPFWEAEFRFPVPQPRWRPGQTR